MATAIDPNSPRAGVSVKGQYIESVSFDNPNSPKLFSTDVSPQIALNVDVNATQFTNWDYEVVLSLSGQAGEGDNMVFSFSLRYAGLLNLTNVTQENVHPTVMIEGPRLIFPFARQLVSELSRNCGYSPLNIDPIDFEELYRNGLGQQRSA